MKLGGVWVCVKSNEMKLKLDSSEYVQRKMPFIMEKILKTSDDFFPELVEEHAL